jgi:serine phosphatase RsbU (regulator of sigma subunit)
MINIIQPTISIKNHTPHRILQDMEQNSYTNIFDTVTILVIKVNMYVCIKNLNHVRHLTAVQKCWKQNKFTMKIKPTSAYEDMQIYYIPNAVNLLHISINTYEVYNV